MQFIKCKTLWFILWMLGEQAVTSYYHRQSAKKMGEEAQNHELRKDALSFSRKCVREIVRSHIFNLENLKLIK